ncbi:MAG: CHAT domain-containing protein, partial [Pseudomonadota bacterium]
AATAALDALCGGTSDSADATLWSVLGEPLSQALAAAGVPGAEGAEIAPEIVVCPSPQLAVLPLAAARNPATGRALLDDYALRLAPSLAAARATAARARRPWPATGLAVTDPLDDLGTPACPAADPFAPDGLAALGPARARRPQQPAESAAPGATPATWAALQAAVAARPGLVLYFGHAHWDRSDAERSGLILAADEPPARRAAAGRTLAPPTGPGPSPGPSPGPGPGPGPGTEAWRGGDLATPARLRQLPLGDTRLVFVAACSGGGIGLAIAPDEQNGINTALLEAGAAGVVSCLWTVLAGPTADVMRLAVDAMVSHGLSPAQALRRAQRRLAAGGSAAPSGPAIEAMSTDAAVGSDTLMLRSSAEMPPAGPEPAASSERSAPETSSPDTSSPDAPTLGPLHPTAHLAAFVVTGA